MYLLGYDIGSSTIKVALVNAITHEVVGIEQYPKQEMDLVSRQIGWAEQQPEVWWQHLCMATRKLIHTAQVDPKQIKGIGIAYQMHGLVLVDKDLQVLRPSIIWCDSRAASIGKQAFHDLGEEFCLSEYLNSPGNFTASKLKWIKDNEPDVYSKIHKILLPGEYIAMKLTGEISTTISGLSEGIFWNFKERKIAQKVLDYFGFDNSLLPEITPTFAKTGKLNLDAAIQTGLAEGTPITYRAGDQPNNALSLNVLRQGEIAATSGTSGVVYGVVNKPIYDEKSRVNAFAHVNYEQNFDRIGILLCINGAGIQYSWMKQQIARSGRSYLDMDRMASSVQIGAEGICVLPFGNGSERIFEDRNLGSHIFNLRFNRHTRAHLYRAALEGVAFTFVYGINILKEMGLAVDVIRVGNDNMFQSKIFSSTIATLLGNNIEVVDTTGAVGAARAAGIGCGIYDSLEEALQSVQPTALYEPNLNYGQCSQAYNYWQTTLNKVINQSKQENTKTEFLKNQNEALDKTIRENSKTIATQSIQLAANQDLLNEIQHALTKILSNGEASSNTKKKLTALKQKLNSQLHTKDAWQSFAEHFNLLNDGFSESLKSRHPSLTYEELKMCWLLKLKLSTKEISDRLNLSIRGTETKRYRLRKKLHIQKGESLFGYLEKI